MENDGNGRFQVMGSLFAALRLMTIIPIGPRAGATAGDGGPDRTIANSPAFFPVAGLVVGLASAGVFVGLAELLPVPVAAALAIAVPVVLSGGLHVDGLADAADGLFGGRSRERRLEIMADPRTGAFGVAAVGIMLLVRWAAVSELDPGGHWAVLVIAAVLSRGVATVLVAVFPYARPGGIGDVFTGRSRLVLPAGALLGAGLAYLFGGGVALIAGGVAMVVGLGIGAYAMRAIGGMTGDVYGASVELAEIGALLTVLALLETGFETGAPW